MCDHYSYWDRTNTLGGNGYDLRMIQFLLDNGADPNACKYYPPVNRGDKLYVDFCSMPLSLLIHRSCHGEAVNILDGMIMLLKK